jgi:uncharacterized protein (TIGR00251 family)
MSPPIRFDVYVQPRAARTELAGMHGGSIKIRIAAPPVDHAANHALIEFLATHLQIAKRRIRLVSGVTSRRKTIEIDGVTAESIDAALRRRPS